MEELHGHSKTLKTSQEVTFYDPIKKLVPIIKQLKSLCSAGAKVCVFPPQVQWGVQACGVSCQTKRVETAGTLVAHPLNVPSLPGIALCAVGCEMSTGWKPLSSHR